MKAVRGFIQMQSTAIIKSSNLGWQFAQLGDITQEVISLFESGNYVSGRYVQDFERTFAEYCGKNFAVGMNSGTSALHSALQSLQIQEGDEVIVPSHTFIATATAVILAGATPVLIDVEENGLVSAKKAEEALTKKTRAIIPVHLYGSGVPLAEMQRIKQFNIPVIEDCSQAHGARFKDGNMVGFFSDVSAYSLYPGKGLGAAGEAGICVTDSKTLDQQLRLFRNWGSEKKYEHKYFGLNYRMDEIQALILLKKIRLLEDWNNRRREIALLYSTHLKSCKMVNETEGLPVYHQYVIRSRRRDVLQEYLRDEGIETLIHYPIPIHRQKALEPYLIASNEYSQTEKICSEILSLPIYPGLTDNEVEKIIESINKFND